MAIYGGGVAGLWTLARLSAAGYRCILIEKSALGDGQTIASQGIIHGGIKYALTGTASSASRAIARMPEIWRACLRGEGEIDLRGVRILSERQWLWTAGGVAARLAGVAASKAIRTEVARVAPADRPAWLTAAPGGLGGVDVYTVDEPVLDPASLLRELARRAEEAGGRIIRGAAHPGWSDGIRAHRRILATGAGNGPLIAEAADTLYNGKPMAPAMQLRPLHMVMARSRRPGGLPLIYGHCLGASTVPRLTITSQHDREGRTVLYIGGGLAEEGVTRSPPEQAAAARAELRACLPWLAWDEPGEGGVEIATLRIDRAEGRTPGGGRPDEPVVHGLGGAFIVWPTKLAFAPLVAQRILDALDQTGVRPLDFPDPLVVPGERPPVATLPWEQEGLAWT